MRLPTSVSRRLREAIRQEISTHPQLGRLRGRVGRLARKLAAVKQDSAATQRKVQQLERTVDRLATELVDARYQGRRAAELSDLVTELLSNEASRRDPEFVAILERYTRDG